MKESGKKTVRESNHLNGMAAFAARKPKNFPTHHPKKPVSQKAKAWDHWFYTHYPKTNQLSTYYFYGEQK